MFNNTFQGGITNYLFDKETYPYYGNTLRISNSQLKGDCDAFYNATEKLGINRTEAARVELIANRVFKTLPLDCKPDWDRIGF